MQEQAAVGQRCQPPPEAAVRLFRAAFLDPTLGRVSKSKDDGCYIWFLKVAQGGRTEILCWRE